MINETSIIRSENIEPLMKDLKEAGISSILRNNKLRIAAGVGVQSTTMKKICRKYNIRVGIAIRSNIVNDKCKTKCEVQ